MQFQKISHTHPKEGYWKFLGEGRDGFVAKASCRLEEFLRSFQRSERVETQRSSVGGRCVDIFCKNKLLIIIGLDLFAQCYSNLFYFLSIACNCKYDKMGYQDLFT